MHHLPRKVDVNIRSFYIFNSTYGVKEGEEKDKILFYHPKDIEMNMKITDVGLSQAFTTFTDTFTEEPGSCEVIHTEKTLQLLYQAEPNFWLVLVLNVPKEMHCKDGVDVAEYHSYELHDDLYRRLLIMSYERFCLEQGTFQIILDANDPDKGRDRLREKLEMFYDKFISSLKLPFGDIFEFTRTLQYLPLDKVLFLRVHNFIESLKSSYPAIKDCLFLYKESVVTCGKFKSSNLHTLHRLILERLSNNRNEEPLPRSSQHFVHKVYLNTSGDRLKHHQMVIYPSTNTTLCLFFPENSEDNYEHFFQDVGSAINSQLYVLARDIEDFLNNQRDNTKNPGVANLESEYGAKYLFVNDQSFKMVQNLCDDERKANLSQNVINLIADLFTIQQDNDVSSVPSQEEIMVKSTDDFWIVKRRGNWRQRFVIVFSTKPTLLDMTKEAERIFDQDIKDGVFADK